MYGAKSTMRRWCQDLREIEVDINVKIQLEEERLEIAK